jgi:predicted esterase
LAIIAAKIRRRFLETPSRDKICLACNLSNDRSVLVTQSFRVLVCGVLVVTALLGEGVQSQALAQEFKTARLAVDYQRAGDQTYLKDGAKENKLDVYARTGSNHSPVVIFWHGAPGAKENIFFRILPLLEMGVSVVVPQGSSFGTDADLLQSRITEGRCALQWVVAHADQFRFDINKVVVAGGSLGGYTALMTGLVTSEAGFEQRCPHDGAPKIAALIDFYGPTTVKGTRVGEPRLAPLTYVRTALPPILIVHGDADEVVPYADGVALDEALTRVGAAHDFLRIAGGHHGHWTWQADQLNTAWTRVRDFLHHYQVLQ